MATKVEATILSRVWVLGLVTLRFRENLIMLITIPNQIEAPSVLYT